MASKLINEKNNSRKLNEGKTIMFKNKLFQSSENCLGNNEVKLLSFR